MNTSMMETAETVEAGHLKLGAEYNMGLDITSTVFLEDDTSETFTATELMVGETYGVRFGIGVTDRTELNARFWVSIGGIGGKLYAKHALTERGAGTSWAVAPGLTFVTTESDDDGDESLDDYIAEVKTFGVEIPVIVTHRFNDVFCITGVVRYSFDSVAIAFPAESPLEDIGETGFLHRLGIIVAPSLDLGIFYLRPEIGVELAGRIHGELGYAPIIGLGAGFEF
jgi:hypothetical protein